MEYLMLSQLIALVMVLLAETFNNAFADRRFWTVLQRRTVAR